MAIISSSSYSISFFLSSSKTKVSYMLDHLIISWSLCMLYSVWGFYHSFYLWVSLWIISIVCVSFSVMSDSATTWTVACTLSMEFLRQDYWSGLPFPSPGDLPDPGIEPGSPALQVKLLEKPISIVVPANLFSQLCLVCWWSHWRNSPCLSLYILFLVFSFD